MFASRAVNLPVLLLAAALYAIACGLPAYILPVSAYPGCAETFCGHHGVVALLLGWLRAPIPWLANPLALVAIYYGLRGDRQKGQRVAVAAFAASLLSLRVDSLVGMGDRAVVEPAMGAYVWIASIFLVLLAFLLSSRRPPSPETLTPVGFPESGYALAEAYRGLRGQVLGLKPGDVGLSPVADSRLWGLLMETGYPDSVVTLAALTDGTVSLYFSNGGGIIGLGQHEAPRQAGLALLAAAPGHLPQANATSEFPLPAPGHTRFYFLTFDGAFTADSPEAELGGGASPLSPLFFKAQDVITQARLTQEKGGT